MDLLQAARVAAKPSKANGGIIHKWQRDENGNRRMVEIIVRQTAQGKNNGAMIRPTYTVAELGVCAHNVPPICFWAALYAFAGDRSKYGKLHTALTDRAQIMRIERRWPLETVDHHGIKRAYLSHLAKLVLDHDAHSALFACCPQLYSIYMGVTEKTWDHGMEDRFCDLQYAWREWLQTANSMIQAKLR